MISEDWFILSYCVIPNCTLNTLFCRVILQGSKCVLLALTIYCGYMRNNFIQTQTTFFLSFKSSSQPKTKSSRNFHTNADQFFGFPHLTLSGMYANECHNILAMEQSRNPQPQTTLNSFTCTLLQQWWDGSKVVNIKPGVICEDFSVFKDSQGKIPRD